MTVADKDQRFDLSSKVAVLDERSTAVQKHLERIEINLERHQTGEELVLDRIENSLLVLGNSIDGKINTSIAPLSVTINTLSAVHTRDQAAIESNVSKLDTRVTTDIEKINAKISEMDASYARAKTIASVLGTIITALGGLLLFFKDIIFKEVFGKF
jgi:uncharacterized protein YejL (UPF0352 family)